MSTSTRTGFELRRFEPLGGWDHPLPAGLNGTSTLVVAFGGSSLAAKSPAFEDLARAFPDSHVLGCSTSGEIHGAHLRDGGLSVAVVRFEKTTVRSASAPIRSAADSRLAGEHLAAQLAAPGLAAVLVYSDGLNVNGSELVRGLASALPQGTIITGALAGDGPDFRRTWVLHGGGPREKMAVAVGLYGSNLRVAHGSRGGWDPFGPQRIVTRSRGNVLFEIDGRPALELYKKYLGDRVSGLPATALLFPLTLLGDNARAPLVRTVLSIDEKTQSMAFAGDIPQHSRVQLMHANLDRLTASAGAAAQQASTPLCGGPCLAIAVSCIGRRLVLGTRTEEELEAVFDELPRGSALIGLYSYGEIAPHGSCPCELHNQTMTLTTIAEV
ncbi:MAG TPA: FIST N-terminal domain-containing protein [Phycisphaerales bacterium]|nr:FIST N-terminal domain-containing protein [Phycisphaerales bacterium]